MASRRFHGKWYEYSHSGRRPRHQMPWPDQTLGSWVQIPIKGWIFVCVYCVFVFFFVGGGLFEVLITRPIYSAHILQDLHFIINSLFLNGSRPQGLILKSRIIIRLLYHVDPLLGNDRERSKCIKLVTE
jgi:hypothetical protein